MSDIRVVSGSNANRQLSPLSLAWRRLAANRGALFSGIILLVIIIAAIFAPVITGQGYNDQDFLMEALSFPSFQHWFGVDDLGRDLFTRVVYGARVSLSIGFLSATGAVAIGLPLGALAGYYGGRTDWVIMRVIELFSVVPPLLAALLLGTITRGGFTTIVFIAALFGWVQVCLLVRAQVKALREKEFVTAAHALGASSWYILWRHLIPNAISSVIVGFVLAIPLAMMLEASLSFLGIGIPPPVPSWGQMINVGMDFMFFYWFMAVFPTAALALAILATTLFGDGLRDALDPTLKGR
ncbi:ABC transporter permease [Martelella sp. HB161492]|uniref:ABC transporter permease n=1 Tax=Martelella sp. HB161492 TaxID=2720726 RepID=UPI0015911037|nr:ABC transporter permease [Martelella sp. HB161492]